MEGLRDTLEAVIAVSGISGILISLVKEGAARELIRLLCGVLLTLTILKPMIGADYSRIFYEAIAVSEAADAAVFSGEEMNHTAVSSIIKEQAEAYILDKAAAVNAQITVDVTLGGENKQIPQSAEISGRISPNARQQLSDMMEQNLGIPKEAQKWNG